MKTVRTLIFSLVAGLALAGQAFAVAPRAILSGAAGDLAIVQVQADCYAIGQDKAAEMGGTLAKAKPDTEGGAPVCRLVIVVPGAEGERPKRVEITVPQ
jgi:hypothetical protein